MTLQPDQRVFHSFPGEVERRERHRKKQWADKTGSNNNKIQESSNSNDIMAIIVVNTGPDVECDTGWVQRWYVTLGVDRRAQGVALHSKGWGFRVTYIYM